MADPRVQCRGCGLLVAPERARDWSDPADGTWSLCLACHPAGGPPEVVRGD